MIDFISDKNKTLSERNLRTLVAEVVLLFVSILFLSFSFPGFLSDNGWGLLSLIAFIPLFYVVRNTTWKTVWFYGFLYGFFYYWIFNYWLSSFHPLANLIVQIIKAVEMIFLFCALKLCDSTLERRIAPVAQTFVFIAYYYLAQSWFAGYPYGTCAYALFRYRVLIQISDLFGIWGIIFMMVLPQAFIGQWLCDRFSDTVCSHDGGFMCWFRRNRTVLCVWTVLFVFQVVYGIISMSYWSKAEPDTSFDVATVQHNADSWKGGFSTYQRNFYNLRKLSLEAMEKKPDLVVWSETAFVPSVNWYTKYPYKGNGKGQSFDYLRNVQHLVDDFVNFGSELSVPLLTGNPYSVLADDATSPYTEDGEWNKTDYNSVILFDEGRIKQSYLKQHLVPFTEHFPYEKQMPHLYALLKANDYHWWLPGSESVVFETSNGIKFSSPICFEDIFGYLCADFVKNGADLLVNMTNDSWSGSVAAERQHMAMAVFRSVENRRSMLRGTNSGITCLITPDGKIQGEMEPFTMGWKIWAVPVYKTETYGNTLYTGISDISAHICILISVAFIVFGILSTLIGVYRGRRH